MDPAPGSALVPLLLLLAVPPGGCCSFDFNPISSTFSTHVDALTPWLILDYPVAMPSNLEMDPQGCVQLETVNVSQLLGTLVQHLRGLQGRPLHFPGCARLRCRPGPPLTTPAVQHEGTLGSRPGPPAPGIHGLVLLGGSGGPGPGGGGLGPVEAALRPGDPGIQAGWDLSGQAGSQGRTQAGLRCWCCRIGAAGEMGTPRLSPGGTEGPWGLQGSPSGGRDGTPQSHRETGGPWPLTATPRGP
ncbi:fms-related tyrosine kinase 3 ligand isoform X2 [Ciconia boyciana]|uniref:fms-related tyrosine kinase 3 ligand isoform X2 n=1 Tax=Ciconia boyciana TaxID=52775 RepID=UPI003BA294C5